MNYDHEYKTFGELLKEIIWDWEPAKFNGTKFENTYTSIHKHNDGSYSFNKLTVTPEHTEYKGHYTKMNPVVYQKFVEWAELTIRLLKDNECYDILYADNDTVKE